MRSLLWSLPGNRSPRRGNAATGVLCATAATVVLATTALLPTAAQAENPRLPLFESHQPLAISLEAPFEDIARDPAPKQQYRDAILRLDGSDIPLRIRARGKNRRSPEVCRFPPLRLNFAKGDVAQTVFAGQDKLKLVTHCKQASNYQRNLLSEYLVYRFYNLLTEYSFRVRLLEVTYIDTSDRGREVTRAAFLIEDYEHLAQRNGADTVEVAALQPSELEPEASNLVDLFQYMIGNTDFSSIRGPEGDGCCHNTQLLRHQDGRYIPIPYDFDNSGLVDAPYAKPSAELPIDAVTQRLYRGFCQPAEILTANIEKIRAQRDAMLTLIENQADLGKRTALTMSRYLGRFFAIAEDERKRKRAIDDKCR